MENQMPTVGIIVNYHLTEKQKQALSDLGCNKSDVLPAVVVAVWGETPQSAVNLKVMVDGNHPDLWVTSVSVLPNDDNGNPVGTYGYSWPVRK
jgi:hypothetical protein